MSCNLLDMLATESEFGFCSINYVLSGRRGRFGARTSARYIRKYLGELPASTLLGLHYNYVMIIYNRTVLA